MCQGLVLFMNNLPLLFQCSNKLMLFFIIHQELCTIKLSLIFDLHFSHQLIFIFNFFLNFLQEFWNFSVVSFLQIVFIIIGWQFRSSKNILDSIWNNKVFIRDKSHNGFFISFGNWNFFESGSIIFWGYKDLKRLVFKNLNIQMHP